jgi:5-methylcytosine-specific restriction enzyme subunit McrC
MTFERIIRLREHESRRLTSEELPDELGHSVWKDYGKYVQVEFPSLRTDGEWELRPNGWVGRIPVNRDVLLVLEPKVPILNLFRMLEYAYGLSNIRFLEGAVGYHSIDDVFERLALILARGVLSRSRIGLYRAYVKRSADLSHVRERLDLTRLTRRPWVVRPHCHFHDHTEDLEENQILAWTLRVIARSIVRREEVRLHIRRASRALHGSVSLSPFASSDCAGRTYNRLNQDYETLHALCRFFLDMTGPTLDEGDRESLPFLLDMSTVFEQFVAEWLRTHISDRYTVRAKETYLPQGESPRRFELDTVLYRRDAATSEERPFAILDMKYKRPERPSNADIFQVVTYAVAKECDQAFLVYPAELTERLDITVRGIRVRSATFALDGDLDEAGRGFMEGMSLRLRPVSR